MVSTATRSQSNRMTKHLWDIVDSYFERAANKSWVIFWCYHVNMVQNHWGMFPRPCWNCATKISDSHLHRNGIITMGDTVTLKKQTTSVAWVYFFIHINAIFCSTLTSSVSLLLFLTKPLTKQAASASSIQPQTSITEGDFEASSNSVSFNAEVQVRLPPIWTQTLDYTWKGWWKSDVINLPSSVVLKGQLKSFCWQCLSEAFSENAANVFSHVM